MLGGLRTVVFHVADVAKAKDWYSRVLEKAPYFDEPYYVGFDVAGYELGLAATENEPTSGKSAGSVTYWAVPDADAAYARLIEMGAAEYQPIADVGDGVRLGAVLDPFGNALGVIYNPHFGKADEHNEERNEPAK